MQNLLLTDIKLALDDLFQSASNNERLKRFEGLAVYGLYKKILLNKKDALDKLAAAPSASQELTERLGQADLFHDGYGGAFWLMTEAYLRLPDLPGEQRQQITKLRETFLTGGLEELKASYADEASRAKERKPVLKESEKELRQYPVLGGATLFDWVSKFVGYGVELDALSSARTAEEANESRPGAAKLRVEILKTLYNCRRAIADELSNDSTLPQNSDALIFGYFDELAQKRAAQNQSSTETRQKQSIASSEQAALAAEQQVLKAKAQAEKAQEKAEDAKTKAQAAQTKVEETKRKKKK